MKISEELEEFIILDKTPHLEKWVLWQIEDRIAQRRSHILCAPSLAIAMRQFNEVKDKQNARKGDLYMYVVGTYDKGKLFETGEEYE